MSPTGAPSGCLSSAATTSCRQTTQPAESLFTALGRAPMCSGVTGATHFAPSVLSFSQLGNLRIFCIELTYPPQTAILITVLKTTFLFISMVKPAFLRTLLRYLIYTTFFVPIIIVPVAFIFPFIVPKILLFRSFTILIVATYVLLAVSNWQEIKLRLSPLTIAVLLFVLSFTISTIAGVDGYHSFWDNHERMLGLFTIIHYAIFYCVTTSFFSSWVDWQKALKVFLVAGSVVMCVALTQVIFPQFLLNQGNARVTSTLGNAIYVGGYGLFLLTAAVLLLLKERKANAQGVMWTSQDSIFTSIAMFVFFIVTAYYSKMPNDTDWLAFAIVFIFLVAESIVMALNKWRVIEAAAIILGLIGLFSSGTRGSIVGLAAGVLVALVGYVIALKAHPTFRKLTAAALAALVVLVAVLYGFRHSTWVQELPAVGRAVNTSLSDIEHSPRWIAWQIAVESWKERPLFGWGPNNFFYAFNAHYNPRSLEFGYTETWFDNAHNIVLNTLAVQGAFGLLTFLAVFAVTIVVLIRGYRRGTLDVHVAVIGIAYVAAHLVENVTVFENPTSYIYFMFWLALANQLADGRALATAKTKVASVTKAVSNATLGLVAVLAVGLIAVFNIQPARANMKALRALQYLDADPEVGMQAAQEALQFNSPHIDDIRSDIGRTITSVLNNKDAVQKFGSEKIKTLFELALQGYQANIALHPLDIRNHLQLADLEENYAVITQNPEYIAQAIGVLNDALTHSPRRQQILFALSSFYAQIGQFKEAVPYLEEAYNDDPKIPETYWRLGFTYLSLGDTQKTAEVFTRADENHIVFTGEDLARMDQIKAALQNATAAGKKK